MHIAPIPPGEVLLEDFMRPYGINSVSQLARELGVSRSRIVGILNNTNPISADTALRLGRFFRMTPEFWLNLQSQYDIEIAKRKAGDEILQTVRQIGINELGGK